MARPYKIERKPPWLRVRAPSGERYRWIRQQREGLGLATVCEEAHCPNIGECWSGGTATFMVMGSICTRGCRFCAVNTQKAGLPLDPEEPTKLAHTIQAMDLDYVVITSVDRDDLPGQGARHFRRCVEEVKAASPDTIVEILIPDFQGRADLIAECAHAGAEVVAHNIECTRELTPTVRDRRAGYDQSLQVLWQLKAENPDVVTKSSIMVGLGERKMSVFQTMRDLREVGCDILTLGQYLRPSRKHLPVAEFVTPEQFDAYRRMGDELGFRYVASGPLVRSSYRAGELFLTGMIKGSNAWQAKQAQAAPAPGGLVELPRRPRRERRAAPEESHAS